MQKIIVSVDFHDDRCRQKAMNSVTGLLGINSISMDIEKKQLTIIGDFDAVDIIKKLRKKDYHANMVFLGPAEEPKKKPEETVKPEPVKPEPAKPVVIDRFIPYVYYNPPAYYYVHSYDENPSSCVIS
ncbi:heavy metal-associated isoprenylated plant protein 39-like isoform X2 [Papaver somniferum]|uniref:heavy metal-associated isoprenylated plant protein 39-like isoform X2 n=1 Tax=Papaver somniferum TaxID=3469 RepID=UPI000E6F6EEA|nr:heavy metal-associated isoprenylated plant protein 39-like isoform X2 [Papaver somniferum]